MFKYLLIFILSILTYSMALSANAETNCLNLQSDLKSGMTNISVTSLQKFLNGTNYLNAAATGHFGVGTLAAVKKFQLANNISTTGIVGPATRALIKSKTCSITNTSDTVAPIVAPTSIPNSSNFTSPKSGDILTIGDSIKIGWTGDTSYSYDIILEDKDGNGAGYIAGSLSGENSYQWKIGNIYNAATHNNENVATGTYKIHLRKNYGTTGNEQISGLFTLIPPPLSLNSVSSNTLIADEKTAYVVYGNGFDGSSKIAFDNQDWVNTQSLYTSKDGKLIVFSVPTNVYSGNHNIMVISGYGVISNVLNVNIVK